MKCLEIYNICILNIAIMYWIILICVLPSIVNTITITPNGNSPETKMTRSSFEPIDRKDSMTSESVQETKKHAANGLKKYNTKLAINERYRRLIPYMTFYYANDLVTPTENYAAKNVEVQKAQIVEAGTIAPQIREPKIIYSSQRHKNIPRYFGNRLTQYNIASSNPTKLYYKNVAPVLYQNSQKIAPNYNAEYVTPNTFEYSDRTYERLVPKYYKPSNDQYIPTRKPYIHTYNNEDSANVQYYSSEKEETPIYKLVPYEQSPPVKVIPQNKYVTLPQKQYEETSIVPPEQVYIKPRPNRPQYINYENAYYKEEKVRKPPTTVSELYYEQKPHVTDKTQHITFENGFQPIVDPSITEKDPHLYSQDLDFIRKEQLVHNDVTYRPTYIEKPSYKPVQHETSTPTIANLLNSLQLHKPIPKNLTRNNVSASIRTLLQVLSTLKAMPQQSNPESPTESTESESKPFEAPQIFETTKPEQLSLQDQEPELEEEPYLAPIKTPSQHLDEIPTDGSSSQRFPLVLNSDDDGGTPGRPGVDYPILTVIPETSFDCKTQRYKGFFADTETRCQVWHYCDLNGGQASFLCPNGTIFSQAGLTCDWWFNVKCSSTTQLYVLNESLYKFILPHSPKFPEDYSGPLVDKYLTLKFKEMEEEFRKNKKKTAKDKIDSSDDSDEKEVESSSEVEDSIESSVKEGHVNVQSVGHSGKVQRLQDD